jgi:hypothetical protein
MQFSKANSSHVAKQPSRIGIHSSQVERILKG